MAYAHPLGAAADRPPRTRRTRATPPQVARRLVSVAVAATILGAALMVVTAGAAAAATTCISISGARFNAAGADASNLNGEWVKITNRCSSIINIRGWRLKDKAGNTYTFASLRMGNGSLFVHTGKGAARPGHRYWGRTAEVWNNSSEKAYLYRADGSLASSWPRAAHLSTSSTSKLSWTVKFGSRPRSGPIVLRNCKNVTISNKTFRNLGGVTNAIRLDNCTNVTIKYVDFINVAEGIYAFNSRNIKVYGVRYSNITGPSGRTGYNTGNFVQFHQVNGGRIWHNKGKGGDTEDVISLFQSSHVMVESNRLEGTNWTSDSGSGIALGDDGGTGNTAQNNILVNIGQVGIHVSGGTNHKIIGNTILGQPRANSNVGIYVWNQAGGTCSGAVVKNNKVYWRKADGTEQGWWAGGGCGHVTMSGNNFSASLTHAKLAVKL